MDERDDEYVDPNGVTWDSYEQYVSIGLCGLCGCGRESIKADLVAILRDTDRLVDVPDTPYHELMLHLLDDKGLLDHGTSISGSWLTDKGKEIRAELRRRRQGA